MVDEIIRILNRNVVKVVTNDGDLVILVSSIFPSVISEIMSGTLGKACVYVARYEFDKGLRHLHKNLYKKMRLRAEDGSFDVHSRMFRPYV